MLTREYLHTSGMTKDELADILGHASTAAVTKKLEVEMPKRWVRLLDERDGTISAASDVSDSEARTQEFDNEADKEHDAEFRTEQDTPHIPSGGETVVGPQRIKLTTIEGYISSIYGGAAALARSRGDELAADVIERYTPEFSEAWIDYIRSDPRLLEYLEKMMIGTPLGNLIGVHAIAIGSYTFARMAARQIATAYAAEHDATNVNGAGNAPPGNPLE